MAANTYVTLDIMKPVSTYVNLVPNFQGRVGDTRASVDLWFKRNGLPLDLTNCDVNFSGVDPNGKRFHAVGWASTDRPGADIQAGRVNYYFPAGMFQVEGHWSLDSTFFSIDDGKGKVSTINVDLNVLPNQVEMGINVEPFETDLDRALTQFKQYMAGKEEDIEDAVKEIKAMNNAIVALNSSIDTYTNLINTKAVPTRAEMQTYVKNLLSATAFSGDLNLCLEPTTYLVQKGASNNPTQVSGGCLLIVKGNEDVLSQILVDNEQNVYVRSRVSGVWSNWREQVAWS
ncbi:BppU family phage baseplate upper protein [Limosilactobacillus fermentum]|uniref:BppU family phage baseplate upper protein n=1 Tax=Limosilactobacillus fermentum TaxID=1613 RepID=UPI001433188A|nr:BppU family phage baseplate upper protein [Limosilactobacillus fermentum]